MEILLYVWVLNQQQNITRYRPEYREFDGRELIEWLA